MNISLFQTSNPIKDHLKKNQTDQQLSSKLYGPPLPLPLPCHSHWGHCRLPFMVSQNFFCTNCLQYSHLSKLLCCECYIVQDHVIWCALGNYLDSWGALHIWSIQNNQLTGCREYCRHVKSQYLKCCSLEPRTKRLRGRASKDLHSFMSKIPELWSLQRTHNKYHQDTELSFIAATFGDANTGWFF